MTIIKGERKTGEDYFYKVVIKMVLHKFWSELETGRIRSEKITVNETIIVVIKVSVSFGRTDEKLKKQEERVVNKELTYRCMRPVS